MSHLTIMGQGQVVFIQVSPLKFAEAAKDLSELNDCEIPELDESEVYEHIVREEGFELSEYDWMVTDELPEVEHR